jgi:hypothetical protein
MSPFTATGTITIPINNSGPIIREAAIDALMAGLQKHRAYDLKQTGDHTITFDGSWSQLGGVGGWSLLSFIDKGRIEVTPLERDLRVRYSISFVQWFVLATLMAITPGLIGLLLGAVVLLCFAPILWLALIAGPYLLVRDLFGHFIEMTLNRALR